MNEHHSKGEPMTFQPKTVRPRLLADDGGRAHGQHREGEVPGTARTGDELARTGSDVIVTGTGKVLGSFRRRRQRFRLQRRLGCFVLQKMTKIFLLSEKRQLIDSSNFTRGKESFTVFNAFSIFVCLINRSDTFF